MKSAYENITGTMKFRVITEQLCWHCSGMRDCHTSVEKYTLSEHAQLRRSLHHKVLLEHQRQGRIFLPENFSSEPSTASDWALDDYYFLQPVPTRQRRALLHDAGVARIDPTERDDCRSLRVSRGRCGCLCREVCQPQSCACYRSGIGCQVDQMAFPCSCSRSGCSNPHGRVEFNAARVRAHFIRTLLQLGLEQNAAVAEHDSELPPPAKRCCFEDDQSPASLSSSFPSSSSSLVSSASARVDGPSVSATNGFNPQTVYFDSAEILQGPEAMVVAYDEDYEEDDDESSSETSSDGGTSCDGISDDVINCRSAATVHDSRQRTLDNYVVRLSRQHSHTEAGFSSCSTDSIAGDIELDTAADSSLTAPQSCNVTRHGLTPQCHRTIKTTHTNCLPGYTAQFCCMPNDTRHDGAVPGENTLISSVPEADTRHDGAVPGENTLNSSVPEADTRHDGAVPGENTLSSSVLEPASDNNSVSQATTHDMMHSWYNTDKIRCDRSVPDDNTTSDLPVTHKEATDNCRTQCYTIYSTASCSAQGTTLTCDDTKHACCPLEDDKCTAETPPENTVQGSCVPAATDSCCTQSDLSPADNERESSWVVEDTTLSNCAIHTDDTASGNTRDDDCLR